jgi:5-formyltetrahydrofolate cyclo-ligase
VNAAALKKAKRAVRREVLAARDARPFAARQDEGARIQRHVLALEEIAGARTVLAFWSFGSEVPTGQLLAALATPTRVLALPRIVGDHLEPRAWAPGDPVEATAFGAMEPADGAFVDPSDLDVILTPAVAFDRDGRRVGYGGGFYDRLFPLAPRAFRLGIGLALQVREGPLPAGAFDLRVHAIVTGEGVHRCPRGT